MARSRFLEAKIEKAAELMKGITNSSDDLAALVDETNQTCAAGQSNAGSARSAEGLRWRPGSALSSLA